MKQNQEGGRWKLTPESCPQTSTHGAWLGYGKNALVFAIMRKIVLEIPALYLLNYLFPLYGLAYAQFVAEFVLAIAAVVQLLLIFRKLGKKQVYIEDV